MGSRSRKPAETYRQLRRRLEPLWSLIKAIEHAQEFGPAGFLQNLKNEVVELIESAEEALAPGDLSWHQADPARLDAESDLARAELKKVRGKPVVGCDEVGRIVVQGRLAIAPSVSKHIVLVYPYDYPNEPPGVFVKVTGGIQLLDLARVSSWTADDDCRVVFEAVRDHFAKKGEWSA